jgi:rhodanese-related sulfurtransferase
MLEEKKNERALLIGFLLIILVVFVFFSKNFFSSRSDKKKEAAEIRNEDSEKLASVSESELAKMMLERKPLVILDIRDPESFRADHIVDSKNVSDADLQQITSSADKNNKYIIIDYAGENSVVSLPEKLKGSENIFILSGGFEAWILNHNSTISAGNPSSLSDQSKISYISNDELKKMIDENNTTNLYLIDVQDSASYSSGHIKGAINIFLDDIEKRRKEIPLGKKVVVYGKDGLSGFQAGTRLFDLGTTNVFVLPDGLDAWKEKGFEVVK